MAAHAYSVGRPVTRDSDSLLAERDYPSEQPVRDAPGERLQRRIGNRAFAQLLKHSPDAGHPLGPDLRAQMEAKFNTSFADVRVSESGVLNQIAEETGVPALTTGQHLYFAPRRYRPELTRGRALIAHELAHVMQQRLGTTQGRATEQSLEMEARGASGAIAVGRGVAHVTGASPAAVATADPMADPTREPASISEFIEELGLTTRGFDPANERLDAAVGTAIERIEVLQWRAQLGADWVVYARTLRNRPPWMTRLFPGNAGPDAVAVNSVRREIQTLDPTARPGGEVVMPGSRTQTRLHAEKTIADLDSLADNLPAELQGFKVLGARERYWGLGGRMSTWFKPRSRRGPAAYERPPGEAAPGGEPSLAASDRPLPTEGSTRSGRGLPGEGGAVGAVAFTAVLIAESHLYQRKLSKEKEETGYAYVGPAQYTRQPWNSWSGAFARLSGMARWLLDPGLGQSIPIGERFDVARWRAQLRERLGNVAVGGSVTYSMQVLVPADRWAGRPASSVEDLDVVYDRLADGSFQPRVPEGGHREGGMVFVDASYGKVPVPDLNVFVSADVTDDDILIMLGLKQPPEQPRMEID